MKISNYGDIEKITSSLKKLSYEKFNLYCFDDELNLLKEFSLADSRDYSTASFSLRDLFKFVLNLDSDNILIAHNHTNNICYPSDTDIKTTNRIRKICKELEVNLLDHIIITDDNMFSFKQNKWGRI